MITKRVFDVLMSIVGLIVLAPIFIVISVAIKFGSKGNVFYKQKRVGKNKSSFILYKFRTMQNGADKKGLLTVGDNDVRVTKSGKWLRKYKMDELPQLFNILKGDMSFVGPRPEVSKYVELYNEDQQRILSVKPGITDWASIKYIDENEILANVPNPEEYYIKYIMPSKAEFNLKYVEEHSFMIDLEIIFLTVKSIFMKSRQLVNENILESK
ncbi:sugar transferase [Pseudopedobacter saltans DSM 12145]|uniref:Sugar transferase n=1 Tax=Pseudopedobacter saltans (strain ATCC 51119 / DSM 12145 / JCM 21818 / CCUG 39354 / LMG 10337 / NBRC 100064 / NCIMB 13643) TaxID=762903 RepID=F0S9N5_PSESL|nr:sugar transferase [Pseudopedobacter saltans]ADY51391.1 sugar transferase [Pseudopedobacter saltans DSM 12145]